MFKNHFRDLFILYTFCLHCICVLPWSSGKGAAFPGSGIRDGRGPHVGAGNRI